MPRTAPVAPATEGYTKKIAVGAGDAQTVNVISRIQAGRPCVDVRPMMPSGSP